MPNFATISGNILADSGISNTLGTSGVSGNTGTAGVSGSSGSSATGTSGTSAISGSSATSGTAGTTVANGSSGTSGLSSSSGTSGSSGTNGTSGSSGSGSSGTSGSNGTSVAGGSSYSGIFGAAGYFPTINGSTGMSYTTKMYQFDNFGTTCVNIAGSFDASSVSPASGIALGIGGGTAFLDSIYNPYAYNNSGGSTDIYISTTGLIGQLASSLKYKTNVKTLEDISWFNQLRPVSFNYRKTDENDNFIDEAYDELWYGFVAEEVEKVNPDLVSYDILEDGTKRAGTIYYYELLAPMYKKVQELDKRLKTLELK